MGSVAASRADTVETINQNGGRRCSWDRGSTGRLRGSRAPTPCAKSSDLGGDRRRCAGRRAPGADVRWCQV